MQAICGYVAVSLVEISYRDATLSVHFIDFRVAETRASDVRAARGAESALDSETKAASDWESLTELPPEGPNWNRITAREALTASFVTGNSRRGLLI